MRKRSKYKPRGVLLNPLGYVLEGMTPVSKQGSYLVDLRIRNHAALVALTQGTAVKQDIDTLIAAVNITEALWRMGFGTEYQDVVREGLTALRAVGGRGIDTNRFVLRAAEMTALNTIMELHDAQLDSCTVRDIDKAIEIVNKEHAAKKSTPILKERT